MIKVPACFELIKAMSKPEKIHFKKYLHFKIRKGEPTIYFKLFDELDSQKTYSLKKIKDKFASQNFIKHLATSYNYLYNHLLKSLRDYNSDKKDEVVARDMLFEVKLLIEKRLLKQAKHQLKRAKKYIEERELYNILYELGGLEHELCVIEMTDDQFTLILAINRKRRDYLRKLIDELDIFKAANTLFDILQNPDYKGDKIADARFSIDELNSFKDAIEGATIRTKTYYFHGIMNYYTLNNQPLKELEVSRALLEIWINVPKNLKYSAVTFSIVIFNHLSACKNQFNADEILSYLPTLDKVVKLQADLKHKCQVIENHFGIYAYYLKNQIDEVESIILNYKLDYAHLLKRNVPFYKVIIINDFIQYFFFKNDFDNCLNYVNQLLSLKLPESLQENHLKARMIEIICHYELENNYLLDSLIKSTRRLINKKEVLEKSDYIKLEFLKHFAKVSTLIDSKHKKYWQTTALNENFILDTEIDKSVLILFAWHKSHMSNSNIYEQWKLLVENYKAWFITTFKLTQQLSS